MTVSQRRACVPTVTARSVGAWIEPGCSPRSNAMALAFADSCAAAGLDAPVAACPGWTVADLLWHLAEVHDFWRTIVRERMQSHEGYDAAATTGRRPAARLLPVAVRRARAGADRRRSGDPGVDVVDGPHRRLRGPADGPRDRGAPLGRRSGRQARHADRGRAGQRRHRRVPRALHRRSGRGCAAHRLGRCTSTAPTWPASGPCVRSDEGEFRRRPRARQGRLRDPRRRQRHPAGAVAPSAAVGASTWSATPTSPRASWRSTTTRAEVTRPARPAGRR